MEHEPVRLVYPPGMEWGMMLQRPHQLLRLAGEAGWQVTWCEFGPYRPPRLVSPNVWVLRDRESLTAGPPSMWPISPIPFRSPTCLAPYHRCWSTTGVTSGGPTKRPS